MNNILKILKSLEKKLAKKLLSKDFKGLKDSFLIIKKRNYSGPE